MLTAQGPHSHNLMMGGEGWVQVTFFGLKIWPKVIFLGLCKTPGFFWVVKKGLGISRGKLKKVVIFLGRQILIMQL